MNMMERNEHSKEKQWRDDIRGGKQKEYEAREGKDDDLLVEDLDENLQDEADDESAGLQGLLQRPYMTTVLLGGIVLLLLCIFCSQGRRYLMRMGICSRILRNMRRNRN